MAVIKATDILSQVARAKARVAYMDEYFPAQIALAGEFTEQKLQLSLAHSIQLSAIARDLKEFVRKLPAPVQNKQAKACETALAYAKTVETVHVSACYNWMPKK